MPNLKGRKDDKNKLRWDLVPIEALESVVAVLTFGANKYADNNWQKVTPFEDRYYAAAVRHLVAYRKGEWLDSDSGLPHLAHAACNLFFLLWKHNSKKGA